VFELGRAAEKEKEKEKEKDFFALTSVWRRLKVPSGGINPIIAAANELRGEAMFLIHTRDAFSIKTRHETTTKTRYSRRSSPLLRQTKDFAIATTNNRLLGHKTLTPLHS